MMPVPEPAPPAPTWEVVSQSPVMVMNAAGQAVQGYRVTARVIATGSTFSVDVPAAQYNADNVKMLLAAAAVHVVNVDGLSG